ncbi:MAG: 50S ribosomal protein L24 [Kiritimatiellae bacterium]|nr:50S ribosomal protein L24 [Kiritimatiellia bacterium]
MHIHRGDTVVVLSGSDAGKTGKVLQVLPKQAAALVEGVRLVTKHLRKSQDNPKGAIVRKEAPIHVSKLKRQAAAAKSAPARPEKKAK